MLTCSDTACFVARIALPRLLRPMVGSATARAKCTPQSSTCKRALCQFRCSSSAVHGVLFRKRPQLPRPVATCVHAEACVYAEALPAASAAPEQLDLASFAALSLPVPQLPALHVSLLDVLSFLLHNPPVTLVAAFAIAYLVRSAPGVALAWQVASICRAAPCALTLSRKPRCAPGAAADTRAS
jgi:hypothetical protein